MMYGYARVSTDGQTLNAQLDALRVAGAEKVFQETASGADTTTPNGHLMLTILGGLAEFERELITARTGEGRARAKARGVKLGAPFKLTHHQKQEALARKEQGHAVRDVARSFNVSPATLSRLKA